ncbi:MAG TPA: DUF1887 family CARF protein [Methylomirabilota bacterium]|nr:DUF1887 family CARF protein [Methylomirabilota bacterium]
MLMLCLVSRQTLQNLLPILHYRPQQVFFLSTKEEDASRGALEPVLRERGITCETLVYVDAYDPAHIAQVCATVRDRFQGEQLIVNLTGGTKVMSLAAYRVFSQTPCKIIYTDTLNSRLLVLHPEGHEPEPLHAKLDILTYLRANGHTVSIRPQVIESSCPTLSAFIGQNIPALSSFLWALRGRIGQGTDLHARLSFLPRQGKGFSSLKGRPLTGLTPETNQLLAQGKELSLIHRFKMLENGVELTLSDSAARAYFCGDWLEEYVEEVARGSRFDQVARGVSLRWRADTNTEKDELDVVILHRYRLHVLSCKTGAYKDHIYELESLSKRAGGLFASATLVISDERRSVAPALRARLDELRVRLWTAEDLPHLMDRMREAFI